VARALLIANPRARRGGPRVLSEVGAGLERGGWSVESHEAGEAAEIAALVAGAIGDDGRAGRASFDAVVGIGGDGTLVAILAALAGTDVPLGIVPAGTGNLLAGNLGIPRSPAEAVRAVLRGHTRRIDLGRADLAGDVRPFAVALGVGFDARVMAATHPSRKRRWGKLAYFATAAGIAPFVEAVPHVVVIDGERRDIEATEVIVANLGELVPGLVRPRFAVTPDDGLLDVIVVAAHDPLRGLLGAWEALIQVEPGEHRRGRVFRTRAREVSIEARPPQPVELDGDLRGTTPVRAIVEPGAVTIIVPR
jgi:diacylglycerol kinase family enzyme